MIVSLSVLFLFAAAQADGFGPSDKVLYFNSETLIAVIKDTFPQNLQLDVANKYVELMDAKGNVSIDDLITVCGVGQLDNAKCKNFIRDLINTMGDDTIKPFYWADYVSKSPEPIRLAVFSSGDGYHKNAGLDSGEWAITFGWMKESNFMRQYPQTKYLRGISACTNESGTQNIADASKNFTLNEQTGEHCWCKMTGPEESAWVYTTDKIDGLGGNCARSCALECVSALRTEPMRAAMFTAVKLNGSNANTNDEKVIGDALITAVTPPPPKPKIKPKNCEFDWEMAPTKHAALFAHVYEDKWTIDLKKWHNADSVWATNLIKDFKCKYPDVTEIRGAGMCSDQKPDYANQVIHVKPTPTNNEPNYCWCQLSYPEQSGWVSTEQNKGFCYSACNELCLHDALEYIFKSIGKK